MIATPDVAHTRCLLLWGGNPEVTNVAVNALYAAKAFASVTLQFGRS